MCEKCQENNYCHCDILERNCKIFKLQVHLEIKKLDLNQEFTKKIVDEIIKKFDAFVSELH